MPLPFLLSRLTPLPILSKLNRFLTFPDRPDRAVIGLSSSPPALLFAMADPSVEARASDSVSLDEDADGLPFEVSLGGDLRKLRLWWAFRCCKSGGDTGWPFWVGREVDGVVDVEEVKGRGETGVDVGGGETSDLGFRMAIS